MGKEASNHGLLWNKNLIKKIIKKVLDIHKCTVCNSTHRERSEMYVDPNNKDAIYEQIVFNVKKRYYTRDSESRG